MWGGPGQKSNIISLHWSHHTVALSLLLRVGPDGLCICMNVCMKPVLSASPLSWSSACQILIHSKYRIISIQDCHSCIAMFHSKWAWERVPHKYISLPPDRQTEMAYHWEAVDRSLARRLRGWRGLFHTTVPSSSSSSSSCQSTCPGRCVHCVCYEDDKHYHELEYQFLLRNPSCSRTTGSLFHPLLPPLSPFSLHCPPPPPFTHHLSLIFTHC